MPLLFVSVVWVVVVVVLLFYVHGKHLRSYRDGQLPYLPYIFGRIKIIIFFTVRTFNLEKNYNFFSVRIFMNAEKLPIIEGIHRYICCNFNVYTDRCENKQFVYVVFLSIRVYVE